MNRILMIAIAAAGLAGCEGITLEEQIKATAECKKAGGRISEVQNGWNYKLLRVDCTFEEPRNHGKPCSDKGGVPILSSWDGTLKDCKFPAPGRKP